MVTETLLGEAAPVNQLAVAQGTYTEITQIVAPTSAKAGATVNVSVTIRNTYTFAFPLGAYAEFDTLEVALKPVTASPGPGESFTFNGTFTMPSKSVVGHIRSRFLGAGGYWVLDDYAEVSIELEAVGWQLLDSRSLSVKATVAPPVGWQPLADRTLSVRVGAPPGVGWQPLDDTTISVAAGPPVSDWELIEHTVYPWRYFYDGLAATWEFEFTMSPEEFPWTEPIAKKVVDKFASDLEVEGSKLLELKIYLDRAGPLWSRWRGEVTVADLEQGGVSGIAIAPALAAAMPWIIKGAVIAAVALVIWWAFVRPLTEERVIHYELSEKIKLEWQVEDPELIPRMITALRPEEYPAEALEGKSNKELRDILNDVYEEEAEEEAPPEPWPWYVWAIIGGLAIGGTAVGVSAYKALAGKRA